MLAHLPGTETESPGALQVFIYLRPAEICEITASASLLHVTFDRDLTSSSRRVGNLVYSILCLQ